MIPTDGEPAIQDLMNRASGLRASEAVLEHSPLADSKTNGRAHTLEKTDSWSQTVG